MKLLCTQQEYDAWIEAKYARASDPKDYYHMADAMDCMNLFVLALEIHRNFPEYREALVKEAPAIIEQAGEDLGTFMSAAALGKAIGMGAEEAQNLMMKILRRRRSAVKRVKTTYTVDGMTNRVTTKNVHISMGPGFDPDRDIVVLRITYHPPTVERK